MWVTIISAYIIGYILCFGIITWMEHKMALPYIKTIQPDYQKSYHNPIAVFFSILSLIGVIVVAWYSFGKFKDIGVMFSYKKLWAEYFKYHY